MELWAAAAAADREHNILGFIFCSGIRLVPSSKLKMRGTSQSTGIMHTAVQSRAAAALPAVNAAAVTAGVTAAAGYEAIEHQHFLRVDRQGKQIQEMATGQIVCENCTLNSNSCQVDFI